MSQGASRVLKSAECGVWSLGFISFRGSSGFDAPDSTLRQVHHPGRSPEERQTIGVCAHEVAAPVAVYRKASA